MANRFGQIFTHKQGALGLFFRNDAFRCGKYVLPDLHARSARGLFVVMLFSYLTNTRYQIFTHEAREGYSRRITSLGMDGDDCSEDVFVETKKEQCQWLTLALEGARYGWSWLQ